MKELERQQKEVKFRKVLGGHSKTRMATRSKECDGFKYIYILFFLGCETTLGLPQTLSIVVMDGHTFLELCSSGGAVLSRLVTVWLVAKSILVLSQLKRACACPLKHMGV